MKRVAIVAGEPSGDLLGADLMRALKARHPGVRFEGIGGPAMLREGLAGLFPQERLSVMGIAEVLRHLPSLFAVRRALLHHFSREQPDLFIGVDSPDFNIGLERRLREAGVRTAHYVSPTVWAWREGRIHGIARAVDLMLTLFPFEARFYEEHGVPVAFVGHPAADRFPLEPDVTTYRERLALTGDAPVVALLPGSRRGEVQRLAPILAGTAARLAAATPETRFVVAVAAPHLGAAIEHAFSAAGVPARLVHGDSEAVMGAADLVITKSGTSTLEAMFLKRPMVVIYRVAPVTAWLIRRLGLMRTERFALPNLLVQAPLVPELIQRAATPERIAAAATEILANPGTAQQLRERFHEQHERLRLGAGERAADALDVLVAS